ncbi:MAG: hypothetical protein HQ527_08630 [Cyanobacteria bacterium]|nr:hypothetical protein [Cyanobacteria bacterium bin.51]
MRTANLNALQALLLSLALMAATPLAPFRAVDDPSAGKYRAAVPLENLDGAPEKNQTAKPLPNADSTSKDARMVGLESKVTELEGRLKASDEPSLLGIAWPLLLAGGSSLIALMLAIMAFNRVTKQRKALLELSRRSQNLLTRIGGVEVQMEQERVVNRSQVVAPPAPKPTPAEPQPSQTIGWPVPAPPPGPAPPSGPAPVSKPSLINSLNLGDRQPLREASTAEMNITSETENALAMGRAIATELEEVPGGGSYWLVSLQGQHWLFPTDRTLKGFAAAQPAKGLFHYEQQTIAQPQLIEPALLANSGKRWRVETMGKIATP